MLATLTRVAQVQQPSHREVALAASAPAHPVSLVTHTRAAGQSASSTQIVQEGRRAQGTSVWTLVPAHVVPMPSAGSSTTSPPAPAHQDTLETHLKNALKNVSMIS